MTTPLTYETFVGFEETVLKWNKIAGNSPENKALSQTYQSLTKEEAVELVDSFVIKDNLVETVDALCDLVYTSFMWACLEGKPLKESAFHTAYSIAMGGENLNLHHLIIAIEEGDAEKARNCVVAMLIKNQQIFDVVGAFEEVSSSNYSKFLKPPVDIFSEIGKIEEVGRYSAVYAQEVGTEDGGQFVIFKALTDEKNCVNFEGDGKLVKPVDGFKEPVLEKFVL